MVETEINGLNFVDQIELNSESNCLAPTITIPTIGSNKNNYETVSIDCKNTLLTNRQTKSLNLPSTVSTDVASENHFNYIHNLGAINQLGSSLPAVETERFHLSRQDASIMPQKSSLGR